MITSTAHPVRRRLLTTPIVVVCVLALAASLVSLGATRADASPSFDDVVDITFPVNNYQTYRDDYLDPRGGGTRTHLATDIMTVYGEPVYATVDGTLRLWGEGGNPPSWGYAIYLHGDDGRTYVYIHLGRQNGPASEAFAPGISNGDRVSRGQHIGFSGHSGNASASAPHLHLEIHDPNVTTPHATRSGDKESDKRRMNPYPSLKAAEARGDTPDAQRTTRTSTCTGKAYAFAGDWDRSGRDGQGWWCDGRVLLRAGNGQTISYNYGQRGDIPIVADWNGNGQDTVSIVRDGTWHINEQLAGGASARSFTYGRVSRGDVPIAGDWNGNGQDTIGIIRDGEWHLRHDQKGGPGQIVFTYGRITRGDLALIGDWQGDGKDTIGIVRGREWHLRHSLSGGKADNDFIYGRILQGDTPVMGDWNRNGVATPGIVRDGMWHLRNSNTGGNADRQVFFPAP